ncbi:BZ3500_MvSof-1268-A1-R1_Chr11-2g03359 [Microbotryum saponariae]|uniref:BZ3500_MvSof-1268-A1-R1_Chr11-2g03359 protein n=1 Tax=Microbotryum saponariae TaxID=289078 RepID=A0A2X0MRX2_9BASI|nr:BZ3500_MvSof-1268-A1-R1_Chr11-2g03359 [Microbotryum saponariae]SDA03199.1 BZ3501_MvSof-1269-A2-R1_Chr11g02930 [Microbotryum saponariae]
MDVAIASVPASSRVQASTAPDKVYGAFPSDLMATLVASRKHQPDSPQCNALDKCIFTSPLVPYRTLADLRPFVRARPQSLCFLPLCFCDRWAMARVKTRTASIRSRKFELTRLLAPRHSHCPDRICLAILLTIQVGNTPTCFNRDEKHLSKNLRSACAVPCRNCSGT